MNEQIRKTLTNPGETDLSQTASLNASLIYLRHLSLTIGTQNLFQIVTTDSLLIKWHNENTNASLSCWISDFTYYTDDSIYSAGQA